MDNINAQNIVKLLQVTTAESLSNDDLKELIEQQRHEDYEINVYKDKEQREFIRFPRKV